MKKKIISVLLLATVTAGAFAFLNKTTGFEKISAQNKSIETPSKEKESIQDDPNVLIEGVWVINNYSFETSTDGLKAMGDDLKQKKEKKSLHYFKNGNGWIDNAGNSPVVYEFKGNQILLYNPPSGVDFKQLSRDQIMKSGRVQKFDCSFPNENSMKFSNKNEYYNLEVTFVKLKD